MAHLRLPILSLPRALLLPVLLLACSPGAREAAVPAGHPAGVFTKPISFALLEDYDKGADLAEVARDFELMRELGVTTWRGSFGWDDYEPAPGRYDFAWLHEFVRLAAKHGITLRPYVGYTPEWAAAGGADEEVWNDPPRDLDAWYRFVHALAGALRRHPNVASYEIYNEENVPLWWDGTAAEYNAVLEHGAAAVRAADPDAQVLLGGMVWPDIEWIEAACETHRNAGAVDVVPFHAYPETWTPESVTVENYLEMGYRDRFLAAVDGACEGEPVWINETGFATTPGKSEAEQAWWWARAFATFLAAPRVEHIGIYEIRDLPTDSPVIGDAPNYYLGLLRRDGTKKLAFHTVDLLTDLFAGDSVTVADAELRVRATAGPSDGVFAHLFRRPDGVQLAFAWTRGAAVTVELGLSRPGGRATRYALDGSATPYAAFDGRTLRDVRLEPGAVRIFEISPPR